MTATAEAPLFENRDWTVSPGGLEHKGTGYFIGRDLLGDRRGDGLWSWPVHMSEKTWVLPESFAQAFMGALLAFEIAPDAELDASFAAGRPGSEHGGRLPPPAGPDAIRIRLDGGEAARAAQPDLPAWALPDDGAAAMPRATAPEPRPTGA